MKKTLLTILLALWIPIVTSLLPAAVGTGPDTGSFSDVPDTSPPENGIPVVSITLDPDEFQAVLESPDHSYEAAGASLVINVPASFHSEFGALDPLLMDRALPLEYIRGRGNSTWLEEKKPFKIKLQQAADLFGMGSSKHWVLLANAKDETLLHNRLAFYIGRRLGLAFTPRFVPVDLVVNGEYLGSYLLGHSVRVEETRVDIRKLKASDREESLLSGGYLLALEPKPSEAAINCITTQRGVRFLIDTPDLSEYGPENEAAAAAQRAWIADYLQQVEDAVFAEDHTSADGVPLRDLMDLESAAKYWWVQVCSLNSDGLQTASTYLYKDRDGKLCFGPLWDFDRAFRLTKKDGDLNVCSMAWLDHLRATDPEYQALLRKTWEELDGIMEEILCPGGALERMYEEIRASWQSDQKRWPGNNWTGRDPAWIVEQLANDLEQRRSEINRNLDWQLTRVPEEKAEESTDPASRPETVPETGTDGTEQPATPGKPGILLLSLLILFLLIGAAAVLWRHRNRRT